MTRRPDDSERVPDLGAAGAETPPSVDFALARSVKRELFAELQAGWEEGQPIRPEDLLIRWPGNPQTDPDVASLLFEDYCQRHERGQEPSQQEYGERFPSQQRNLADVSRRQEFLRSLGGPKSGSTLTLALPTVGDEVFGFRLRRELGRGSFARVFLAEQMGLAGRPVVVKISAIDGDEPQTLAQMQHTNIVPIYSVHEDEAAGLRVVCMPYFGGASLSRVLQFLWAGDEPTTGAQLVQSLALVSASESENPQGSACPANGSSEAGNRGKDDRQNCPLAILSGLSLVRACAWVTARLAEALQHAHQRGVLHRDIKPSNILLSADGEPMLLDFNLAQNVQGARAQALATLGGTVAYMAPEHLRALAVRDPALVRQVDHRADIYGLGMVLYEMLTGRRPFDQSGSYSPIPALIEAMAVERGRNVPSLRERRSDVPWSLESIARKCLAPDPTNRYQHVEQLAEDLRRFLEDRPLKYAPELSWRERAAKWTRRHPRLTPVAGITTVAALLLAVVGTIVFIKSDQLKSARQRIYEAEGAEAREKLRDFQTSAERARCLIDTKTDLRENLPEGTAACEKALGYYDVLGSADWQQQPSWQRLEAEERDQLADDVREMLLLLAQARASSAAVEARTELSGAAARVVMPALAGLQPLNVLPWLAAMGREAPVESAKSEKLRVAVLAQAIDLLDRAQAIPGLEPSAALFEERASYLDELGDRAGADAARTRARKIPPRSARDHYLRAVSCIRKGQFAEAVPEFKQAVAINPRHYWSRLLLGTCYDELHQYDLALCEFSACLALWPEFAWGHFNRGRAFEHLRWNAAALEDYNTALRHDPRFAEAFINRGALYLEQGTLDPSKALADFDAATALLGRTPVKVAAGRGIALERLGRFMEADEAFGQAGIDSTDDLNMLLGYAFAVCDRLPKESRKAFIKILDKDQRNPMALYGYAMLLARQSRQSEEALTLFSLALQVDPSFVSAREGRANVLAHRGDWIGASQEIDLCVKLQATGPTLYQAACVYALMAGKAPEKIRASLANRALDLLREAFDRGYGQALAADDPDLASLRKDERFRQLLNQASRPKDRA